MYRIGRIVTPAGIAVAASVVAYLVGVVVLQVTSVLTKIVLGWRSVVPAWLRERLPGTSSQDQVTKAFEATAIDRVADRVRDDAEFRAALVQHGVVVGRLTGAEIDENRLDEILRKDSAVRHEAVQEACDDDSWDIGDLNELLPLMVQRMRGRDDQFATEYDRLTTESDFRAGMAWPLFGLFAVLAVRSSVWWLGGLPAVLLLISSASGASLQATRLLNTIVASRRYEEPAMQVLDSIPAQQLLNRKAHTAWWTSRAAREVTALAISSDNAVIAGGTDDGYLLLWDRRTGGLLHSLAAHRDSIEAVAFSPDGTRIVTAGADSVTCVWDPMSGQPVHKLDHQQWVSYLAFEPGTGLLTGVASDSVLYWNISDGTQVDRRKIGESVVRSASMSPDGTLVIGFFDHSVVVIRGDHTLHPVKTGDLVVCCALNEGLFVSLEKDKDRQRRLVRWRQSDNGLIGSNLSVPQEPWQPVVVVDYESAPKIIFTTLDDEILLLSLDGDFPPRICGKHEGGISTFAISPDTATLVSASGAGTVHVHDLRTGKLLLRLVPQIQAKEH